MVVLDMGEPVRIVELAEKMIHVSGLGVRSDKNPHGDISVEFTELRPGEKLYEELLIGENVVATPHLMIMSANEDYLDAAGAGRTRPYCGSASKAATATG